VTVEARSLTALTDIDLVVRGPSGAQVERGSIAVGRDGDWHTWTVVTAPLAETGTHEIVFTAAGDVEETGAFDAVASQEPPPLGRGQPRVQYERTYVLLPPDAGEDWALAVVDGTWDRRRYTVGSSADDAGIGDLDVRRVIAVNPSRWPGDLRAFFEEFYRGVEYTAVEADTPEELRQKLEAM
jgi:hypothetical protein